MKFSTYALACFLMLTGFVLSSCEKTEFLKSEKGIMSELNGTWSMIQIPSNLPDETWTFDNGTIIRKAAPSRGENLVEIGRASYTVHTTMTKVTIDIDGIACYTGTWQIIKLTKSVLVLDTDFDGNAGILEKNFQKK